MNLTQIFGEFMETVFSGNCKGSSFGKGGENF